MKNSIFALSDDLLNYLTTHANSLKDYLPIEQELEGMPCKSFYGDIVFESLLLHTLPKIEDLVGKKLWPTYSFFRSYIKNSLLPYRVSGQASVGTSEFSVYHRCGTEVI